MDSGKKWRLSKKIPNIPSNLHIGYSSKYSKVHNLAEPENTKELSSVIDSAAAAPASPVPFCYQSRPACPDDPASSPIRGKNRLSSSER